MSFIYALELRKGKYYVGKTEDLDKRYKEHQKGIAEGGAKWTEEHPPTSVMNEYLQSGVQSGDPASAAENALTIKLMIKYGVDNVRGGLWCRLELTEDDRRQIAGMMKVHEDTVKMSRY